MELTVECSGDVAVVTLPLGDLDASNAPDLKRDAGPLVEAYQKLVFDLSQLRFVDSSGLGALLSCLRKVNARGGELKLCSLSKQVQSVFELVRMHRVFDIHATRDGAVNAFEAFGPAVV